MPGAAGPLAVLAAVLLGLGASAALAAPRPTTSAAPLSGGAYGPGNIYGAIPPIDDRGRDQLAMFRAWNADPVGNDAGMLASVRPSLASIVRRVRADEPTLAFVVGSGLRGEAEQRQAALWGWSPGVRRGSASPHGRSHLEGRAVDLWPLDAAGRVLFSPAPQARLGAAMKRAARVLGVALSWGGDWRGRKDPSHFELRR